MPKKQTVDLAFEAKPDPTIDEVVQQLQEDEEFTTEKKEALVTFVEILESGMLDRGNLETGEYLTKRGIKLQAQRPNEFLIRKALERFKPPEVPTYYDEEFEEERPNPADEDYQIALARHNTEIMLLTNDLYMSHTLIIEPLPEGILPPSSEDWVPDVEMFGIEVPKVGRARVLSWLNYYALDGAEEANEYMSFLQLYNYRLKEADIREKVDSFRRLQREHPDSELSDKAESAS